MKPRTLTLAFLAGLAVAAATIGITLAATHTPDSPGRAGSGLSIGLTLPITTEPVRPALVQTNDLCPGADSRTITEDNGAWTLTIASDYTGEGTRCVLADLDTPQRVIDHFDYTRAIDGQQTDQWPGYEARWTYHPDSGIDMTIWETS